METRSKLILGMLIASVSLNAGAVSFSLAWYANATRVGVRYVEMDIRGERDLKIKPVDSELDYVDELTRDDLHQVPAFDAVSTMFRSRWEGKAEPEFYAYSGYFVPSSGVPYGPEHVTQGFFQQHFYLKCDDDAYVSLDPLNCAVRPDYEFNRGVAESLADDEDYAGFTVDEIYERLNKLEKALRISIYDVSEDKYYIFDPYLEGETYYGGILDNDGEDPYFDYYIKDNIKREVVYGEYNDFDLIRYEDEPLEEDITVEGETNCFNAYHRQGVYMYSPERSYEAGLRFVKEPAIDLANMPTGADYQANPFILNCYRDTPKEIVLSLYLEGWDKDCVNTVMGASFLSQLQFKIVREM